MSSIRCPICGKSFDPAGSEAMPFCSPRCKQVDLGRWLDEKHSVPYESEDEPDRFGSADSSESNGEGGA